MRRLLMAALFMGMTSSAFAQQSPGGRLKPDTTAALTGSSGCWPVTSRDRVVVRMDDGAARTGTMLCMGPDEVMLTGGGTIPLSEVRQISKPRDSALDGVLKGAAVGLVIVAFCAPDCPAEVVLRSTLAYATIGGVIDGLQGNNKTIYRREPRAILGWRVRF